MASRPPLGIALADMAGAPQPKISRGQLIAGILADALSGAAGQHGQFAEAMNHRRDEADQEAQWGRHLMMQKQLEQQYPDPSPMVRDVQAWQQMTPDQQSAYRQIHPLPNNDPDVFITLPNGQVYAGPRSGLAAAMTGGAAAPPKPVGPLTPLPDDGGPTPPASGGFPPY